MLITAVLYWKYTQDLPEGNFADMRRMGLSTQVGKKGGWDVMKVAGRNYRVWLLGACYGASFGVELFVHSIAATYYFNRYQLSLEDAGLAVGAFGLLALFARAVGGLLSDRVARTKGLDGRTWLLFAMMMGEGVFLIAFSQAGTVTMAVLSMLTFGLFTHMACGSLYALVPFIDRKVLGGVCGIIGAGGNIGGVAAGLLLRFTGQPTLCFMVLGIAAIVCACGAAAIRFSMTHKRGRAGALRRGGGTAHVGGRCNGGLADEPRRVIPSGRLRRRSRPDGSDRQARARRGVNRRQAECFSPAGLARRRSATARAPRSAGLAPAMPAAAAGACGGRRMTASARASTRIIAESWRANAVTISVPSAPSDNVARR